MRIGPGIGIGADPPAVSDPTPPQDTPGPMLITREGLADGSMLARVRAHALPGMVVRDDTQIEESLAQTLCAHDPAADVWVFGYGSLMWNPAFCFAEQQMGVVRGWHRRFCLRIEMGRGSPTRPGLMLGLDKGGTCRGVAFRIPAATARGELLLIWRREMFGSAYQARWVPVRIGAARISAITFVVDRSNPRYVSGLTDHEVAQYIAGAAGALGSCTAYFESTIDHLHSLGIRDAGLQRIAAAMPEQVRA